ncbi:hypothetical protein PoB_000279300 [Plakobranchus ocellatus]|uniref:Uncharacterized protein n=1 Tax=Plakobranchus ocellatus TaxID=259542 RepID=A0AAV3Y1Q8_9GAST|nr:hypothetical protein PoB_000279300 [Plakobranchus ocellatus]
MAEASATLDLIRSPSMSVVVIKTGMIRDRAKPERGRRDSRRRMSSHLPFPPLCRGRYGVTSHPSTPPEVVIDSAS